MAPKTQLQQLLKEDQEPFHLHDYIADRRTKLRTTSSNNQLQLCSSRNNSSSALHFPVTFCKNACFNAKNDSPDLNRASPVFHLPKSPVKMLQIPSKTAALLLEAALRIHKHSSRKHTNRFGTDFGFFGSVLKKLSVKTPKRNNKELQTSIFRRDASSASRRNPNHLEEDSDIDFCCNGRRSDAVWSEDKSLDTETSCSSSNSDLTRIVGEHTQSPTRCPSPDFSSHPPSPTRRSVKDEEEKEQCSPVCVLDPPFEEGEDEDDHDHEDVDEYGHECSYAIVQKKNQQLLHKLSRFEALADLDPKELEQLIIEDEADLEISSVPAVEFLQQVLEKCGFHDQCEIPIDMKRLVSDLIAEEEMKDVVNTVGARFSAWKDVEQNTIDMMVGEDFKRESGKWKTNQDELRLVVNDIELAIYASLVTEIFM